MPSIRRRFTDDDKAVAVYQYLPFDVPAGTRGIEITFSYDRSAARLDLGLYDAEGFRGWSGSERSRVALSAAGNPAAATPGYLAGAIEPGTWQVVVGLYQLPADGVDVEVDVVLGSVEPERAPPAGPLPERPPRRDLPGGGTRSWLAGDLHCHSVHSDGEFWPAELASRARAIGLDFLAVTDHNTVSHHVGLTASGGDVTLLPGQEVTTEAGHAIVLGECGWVDFRLPADNWLTAAENGGALMWPAHPVAGPWSWTHPTNRPTPLVEGWHGSWDGRWPDPYEWSLRHGGVLVGGSDFHRRDDWARLAVPTTYVQVDGEPSTQSMLDALAAGRVAISADPAAPVLLHHGGQLVAIDGEGTVLESAAGPVKRVSRPLESFDDGGDAPYRLVDGTGRCVAVANRPQRPTA